MNENPYQSPNDHRASWPSAQKLWEDKRAKPYLFGAPCLAIMSAVELAEGKMVIGLIAGVLSAGFAAVLLKRANAMRRER